MINLNNIISAPIILDPWPHKVIDNIFDLRILNSIIEGGNRLVENAAYEQRDPNGLWMFKAIEHGVDIEIIDIIMNINLKLLQNYSSVLQDFPNAMLSQHGYFSIPRFNYIGPNVIGSIHDEGDSKTMALVIYLTPEENLGTHLYKTSETSSYVKTIEWKSNRGFLMVSQPGVTWHSFQSQNSTRLTLNFYYEKFEKIPYIDNLTLEKKTWFWDEYAKGRNFVEFENA